MQDTTSQDPHNDPHPQPHMLEAALEYARKGWRILPLHSILPSGNCSCGQLACRHIGKHPRILQGVRNATNDTRTIENWWRQDPTANIGIATGNGLLVINVDPRNGGFLQQFIETYALPVTALVQTGGGGWHLYFVYNKDLFLYSTMDKLGRGIDSKGEGSYVVAPPSQHETGKRYVWLNTVEAASLPAILLPVLLNAKDAYRPGFWSASSLQRVQDQALLPTGDSCSQRFVSSIKAYKPVEELEQPAVSAEPLLCRLDVMFTMPLPEPLWVLPELLVEGVTLLTGKPKVGKTWLSLAFALAIASGSAVLGSSSMRSGDVLFLGLEDTMRCIYGRARKLLQKQIAPSNFTWAGNWSHLGAEGLADLEDWLELHPSTRLIVIDSLARVCHAGSGRGRKYMPDRAYMVPLKIMAAQYHVAILVISHLPASAPVGFSNDLADKVDATLFLQREYGQPEGELHLLGSNIEERMLQLEFQQNMGFQLVSELSGIQQKSAIL